MKNKQGTKLYIKYVFNYAKKTFTKKSEGDFVKN